MTDNRITVIYGSDPTFMTRQLLVAEDVKSAIPSPDTLIGIKPNLVTASPASNGATTHPEIAAAVIEYLQGHGFKNLVILEGSWVGASTSNAFRACGYEDVAKKYGVGLVDLQKDGYKEIPCENTSIRVCDKVLEVGYLISLPVLKGHCQTGLTCALKNMKGCIPDNEKRRFHSMGLHRPIALLNKVRHADLVIVDGLNGDLNFEEGGNPAKMNRMFIGVDSVLIDSYCANLIGFDKSEIKYIEYAESLKVGSSDLTAAEIRELNHPPKDDTRHIASHRSHSLSRYIDEHSACSACYAGLVNALDKLERSGELRRVPEKFCIGQGFANRAGEGIGVGSCTARFEKHIPGCPVRAIDVAEFVRNRNKRK